MLTQRAAQSDFITLAPPGDAGVDDSAARLVEPGLDEPEAVLRGREDLALRPGMHILLSHDFASANVTMTIFCNLGHFSV
jgi:hypothetical protein